MKKILLTAAMCCTLITAGAQEFLPIDGSSYYLPKTALRFSLLVEKTTYTPGEFCAYAYRYLKEEASSKASSAYRIVGIDLKTIGLADTSKIFTAHIDNKHTITQLCKADNGVLLGVNQTVEKPEPIPLFTPAPKPAKTDPRSFLTQEMLSTGSKMKMAELIATEIYDLRESRNQLVKGQAETMPTDGHQLQLMLSNLDRQERAYLQLFKGVEEKDTVETIITFVPEKEVERELLFRFSRHFGIVDSDDLSGSPYYITVLDQHNVPSNSASLGKDEKNKNDAGIYVNLPGKANIKVYKGEKLLGAFEQYMAQFGRTEPLMGELFGKKVETRIKLSPVTGNMDTINTELRK